MSEWISVKDRLPEKGKDVIAYRNRTKELLFCVLCEKHWESKNAILSLGAITHWIPIPEPPKEEPNDR